MKLVTIQSGQNTAGDSSYRHTMVFLQKGLNASLISGTSLRKSPSISVIGYGLLNLNAIAQSIFDSLINRWLDKSRGSFSYPLFGRKIHKSRIVRDADAIIIASSFGGFLNLSSIKQLLETGKPVFFIMRDMWWITGGCHHSFECNSYKSNCSGCKIIDQKLSFIPSKLLKKKIELLAEYDNFSVIGPSQWIVNKALESRLFGNSPVYHIPNFVPRDIFKKINKNQVKSYFGIPESKFVIGFGGKKGTDNPYKGFGYLIKALNDISSIIELEKIHLFVFGIESEDENLIKLDCTKTFAGFVYDDRAMNLCYNAMDVFVVPSVADNLPSTVLESLSAETPVVGFETGGIPEMIAHKKNGFIARYRDSDHLKQGIKFIYDSDIHGFLLPEFQEAQIYERWSKVLNLPN